MQNQPKTRLRESSQTFPGFQDRVKIKTRDPHFSRNHSIHLITYPEQAMNFFFASFNSKYDKFVTVSNKMNFFQANAVQF